MRWCILALLLTVCACDGSAVVVFVPFCATPVPLTAAEVETIIAQAATRALADGNAYVITVVNRDGVVVGAFEMSGVPPPPPGDPPFVDSCRAKARTAAFLSSTQQAFNTRTAKFIIQNNFPMDVPQAPGGPLYGVQFSSMACSDVVGEVSGTISMTGNGLSKDFGSMPLYRVGCLIGGVAVDGGTDNLDEERAAWAASAGFRPDPAIFGSQIFIDGVRLEFMKEMPVDIVPVLPFGGLAGTVLVSPVAAPPDLVFPMGVFGGLTCEIRYPIIPSPRAVPATDKLTATDITDMLDAGAARSAITRAGIRRPLGTPMRCFISVVDTDGTILGSIRTPEATLFSFDVSIQKARTCAFFSTDAFAVTCRAMGFMAQGFFPPGITGSPRGPLANDAHLFVGPDPIPGDVLALQDALSLPLLAPGAGGCGAPIVTELANGITIFPGGVAVYKGGMLVGAIGVSGDGVDQDDFIAQAGGELFPPPAGVRCDEVSEATAVATMRARLAVIKTRALAIVAPPDLVAAASLVVAAVDAADANYAAIGLRGLRLPYVKFPRQPFR